MMNLWYQREVMNLYKLSNNIIPHVELYSVQPIDLQVPVMKAGCTTVQAATLCPNQRSTGTKQKTNVTTIRHTWLSSTQWINWWDWARVVVWLGGEDLCLTFFLFLWYCSGVHLKNVEWSTAILDWTCWERYRGWMVLGRWNWLQNIWKVSKGWFIGDQLELTWDFLREACVARYWLDSIFNNCFCLPSCYQVLGCRTTRQLGPTYGWGGLRADSWG